MADNKNFDKELKNHLQEIQKRVVNILKKIKRPSLDYNIQFSLDCMNPTRVSYSVWIQPPAERINRLSWIGKDYDDLIKQLESFNEKTDEYTVEIAYHNAQIESCKETIKHHEDVIDELVKLQNGEEESE